MTIKVAMIGFGGIAQLHRYAYWMLSKSGVPVKLIAACDSNPEKFRTKTRINLPLEDFEEDGPFGEYYDMEEMLEKEKPDLVDICLPTRFHADTTIKLLKRGYNVLCEKPMASTYEDCQRMLQAVNPTINQLMIGQCLRFYPEYEYLQDLVVNKNYGEVINAEFYRYSPPPFWSGDNWQMNVNQSGGCLVELNIHDIDYIRWAFGEPNDATCCMESRINEMDYVESHFNYDTCHVKVHSGWTTPEDTFKYGYQVQFEQALLQMQNGKITVQEIGKEPTEVPVTLRDGVIGEIEYFVNILLHNLDNEKNPPESSARTMLLLEKLRDSAEQHSKPIQWRCLLDE